MDDDDRRRHAQTAGRVNRSRLEKIVKPKHRRTPPDWMAICAYNIVNMLPADPKKAKAVLELANEFVDEGMAERGMRISL
jgi:hypothetical protein